MPLTECPDCGGIVSDQALTCPTCHRVLAEIDTEGVVFAKRLLRWTVGGLLAIVGVWVLVQLIA
jgi:hypothetical protein